MNTNLIPFVNHSGIDTINQRRLIRMGSKRSMQIIDYIIKLNGLFSGSIPITDTYLLDHRPLQNWLMDAPLDALEYLVPQDSSILPGVFVTTRNKNDFEDILKTLIRNRMLFSSQEKNFDYWIRSPGNKPSMDEFLKQDKRGEDWWKKYLQKIDSLFDEDARKVWVFGPYNFPGRLEQYLDYVRKELRPQDPYAFDYFLNLITRKDPPITRTDIVRWLRDTERENSSLATLTHQAYRAVLAESTDMPGKIVDNIAQDTWPSELIPKAILQAAEEIAKEEPLSLDIDYQILIDKLPWETLLILRSHDDFKQSLLELSRATSNIDVDERTIKKAIKNHFKMVGKILENTSASSLFISRTGTSPQVQLRRFKVEVGATTALMASAILMKSAEFAIAAIPGFVAITKDLINFYGNDPLIRFENAFGHVERTLLQEVTYDELPPKN